MSLYQTPWPSSPAPAPLIDPAQLVEEEKTPYYDPVRFYPAQLGQIVNERYQIATKLGYGSSSTVWLARDLNRWRWSGERYVAVKINASSHHSRKDAAEAEHEIMNHITQKNPQHKG
ncbi:Serine/threonine-protein kinase SRPK [Cladobotryum mycophilum]|uniref:non-specific serine/threonine protein kinase n=1 Tax=Cladobotryum mycophilum TaxID=491253 RepID=A0ABR0SXE3_9HYPO